MSVTKSLNIAQVAAAFGVSQMAVFNWRRGTSTREPLTCLNPDERSPRFSIASLKRYAKQYDLTIVKDPDAVIASWKEPARKKSHSTAAKKTTARVRSKPKS